MQHPKVLLLQVRDADDAMREHEVSCFVERAGLRREDITAHCALTGVPTLAEVRAHDALMLGGSGAYYVSKENQPTLHPMLGLLQEVATVGHPTFAACYGYQCMVRALGGEIVHDPDRTEVGTYAMELTEAGKADPLFGALPHVFDAQQGHKDRAERLPEGFENLVSSQRCGLQAFRVPGQPVWGVQFHPELDESANRMRYMHYLEAYSAHMSPDERQSAASLFRPSPDASSLLRAFIAQV